MWIRSVARQAALAIPPVRRLWNEALRAGDLARRVEVLTERADTLVGELTIVSEERDSLEVQLYVLRADHQRTLARADATRQEMGELRAALAAAEAKLAGGEPASAGILCARLSEQLAQRFDALEAQLRSDFGGSGIPRSTDPRITLYLDLLEKAVTGQVPLADSIGAIPAGSDKPVQNLGCASPGRCQTMLQTTHARHIRVLAERVLEAGVPGDFVAAGVQRGEACTLMCGVLAAYGVSDRTIWFADAFSGSLDLYGLLGQRVRLLKGSSPGMLPVTPIEKVALLYLGGAPQSAAMQALEALYPKLSPGGLVIGDDAIAPGCRPAVDEFRAREHITDPLELIDGVAMFWRKSG